MILKPERPWPLTENWQPIPGYEKLYEASNLGGIRSVERHITRVSKFGKVYQSIRPGRRLAAQPNMYGFMALNLFRDNRPKRVNVAEQVLLSFHYERPPLHRAKNLDGDLSNCQLTNLSWVFAGHTSSDADEAWRPVLGWEDWYEASSLGRIRSVPRAVQQKALSLRCGKLLAQALTPDGYLSVTLCRDGKRNTRGVHAIVCEAFHGARPNKHEAAHNDGNPKNNRAANLRWASRRDQEDDKIVHGLARRFGVSLDDIERALTVTMVA